MIAVRQHIPNYVSGIEPAKAEIADASAFLALEWVKRWTDDGYAITCSPYCHHYPFRGNRPLEWIVEAVKPEHSWVVGYSRAPIDGLAEKGAP